MNETRDSEPPGVPLLKTQRTMLRPLETGDEAALFKLRSDPDVNRYITRERDANRAATRAFITRIRIGMKKERWLYWAICNKADSELMGTICLWNFSPDRKCAEIGYELFPRFQGKGIMQEVLETVIPFCANELKIEKLEAFTHQDNERSTRLLSKNGFVRDEGRKEADKEGNIVFRRNLRQAAD